MCVGIGKLVPADTVDHIEPHGGDPVLFWDEGNWQSLCKHCHDSYKQAQEKGGLLPGCDLSGMPLDPRHPWNRPQGRS